MFEYTLSMHINNQIFIDACQKIEAKYPFAKKEKTLVDVDGSLYQEYIIDDKIIKVQNDCMVDAVYIDSEVDLGDMFMSLV